MVLNYIFQKQKIKFVIYIGKMICDNIILCTIQGFQDTNIREAGKLSSEITLVTIEIESYYILKSSHIIF